MLYLFLVAFRSVQGIYQDAVADTLTQTAFQFVAKPYKIGIFGGVMSTILSIVCFLFLGAMLLFTQFRHLSSIGRTIAWVAKGISALALIYIYTNVYPKRSEADIFKYFDDSKQLTILAYEDPSAFGRIFFGTWESKDLPYLNRMNYWFRSYDHGLANDNRMVIRVNALMNLMTRGVYGINLVLFLFLSFLGCYWIYAFLLHFNARKPSAFVAAFLIPSTLFWSSGILKESLLMFALGGFLWSLLSLSKKWELRYVMLGCLTLYMLLFLKIYILCALAPMVLMYALYCHQKSWWIAGLGTFGFMVLLYVAARFMMPQWSLFSTLQGKQFDFIQMAKSVNAGSQIWVIPMDGTWGTFLKLIPLGIWNTLYYPNAEMLKNALSWVAFVENACLFLLIIGAAVGVVQRKMAPMWVLGMLLFGFAVFSLIGMTAPVVGAMVRYKAPVLPFLVFGLLYLQPQCTIHFFNNQKIIQWLSTRL